MAWNIIQSLIREYDAASLKTSSYELAAVRTWNLTWTLSFTIGYIVLSFKNVSTTEDPLRWLGDLQAHACPKAVCVCVCVCVCVSISVVQVTELFGGSVLLFVLEVHRKFLCWQSMTDLYTVPLFTRKCVTACKQHTCYSCNYEVLPIPL
jgi:hypothetical protein